MTDKTFYEARYINQEEKFCLTFDGDLSKAAAIAKRDMLNGTLHPADFSSSGLGIGGLAQHVEKPIAPNADTIERVERMEREATICRSCGESDLDGAMFTTMSGGNVCDDCF